MKTVTIKSAVAAITGLSGAILAACYGYANYAALAGFGAFFLTLGIQYASVKIKIIIPLLALLAYLAVTWH